MLCVRRQREDGRCNGVVVGLGWVDAESVRVITMVPRTVYILQALQGWMGW